LPKQTHILNAASNLLGIALIIITALHVAGRSIHTMADEITGLSAICFSLSCLLSYFAIRAVPRSIRFEAWADRIFLAGLFSLLSAVATLAFLDS